MQDTEFDPLLLIPIFILDFLCIHPFNDGNGRMSRLLTLLLLYRSGYIMRNKHKHGEMYYWLLYYSYLSPQQYRSVDEIIEMIRPHVSDISERTFFRRRKNAVEALSSILWGYTSRDSLSLMEQFFPDK